LEDDFEIPLLLRTISHQRSNIKERQKIYFLSSQKSAEKAVECHLAINLGLRLRKFKEKEKKGSLYQPDGHPLPVLKHGPRSPLSSRDQKDNTKKTICFLLSDPSLFLGFLCFGKNTHKIKEKPRTKKFTVKAKGKSWQKRDFILVGEKYIYIYIYSFLLWVWKRKALYGYLYVCNSLQFEKWKNPMDSVLSESIWQWDPKVGDLYQATMKPWETVVEVGSSPDVQIALSQLGIGAKDSPNHLVAGFPRSFPQDSWSWGNGYENDEGKKEKNQEEDYVG